MLPFPVVTHLLPPSFDATAAWQETRKVIETRYFARKERGEELKTRLDAAEASAIAAKDEATFDRALDDMIAAFGDSHFGFFTRAEPGYYLMDALVNAKPALFPAFGVWLEPAPPGYRVQMVLNGGEAEKLGVRPGDILKDPDGKTLRISDWSTSHELKLQIIRGDQSRTETFHPQPMSTLDMFLEATRASVRTYTAGERKIGYVHQWTMANNRFPQVLVDALEGELKGVNGLILDLRDGFGGRPERTLSVIETLPKDLPLIVLINGGSRSAKEVAAARLKLSKRALLVGSRTAGHVIGTFPYRLKGDWAYLEVPMVKVNVEGVDLERKGVEPDIPVKELYTEDGEDAYIRQALKLLNRKPDELPRR